MALINWKLELKLEWTKYWVLSAASSYNYSCNVNEDVHNNNTIFTVKDTQLYAPVVTLSARDNRKLSDFLVKELKEQFLGMNIKQKVRLKQQQTSLDIFSNQILSGVNRLFALTDLNRSDDIRGFKNPRYYSLKGIIKNYKVIINGKNFYDQEID